MRQTIDAMSTVPVYIQNGRLDAVATNRLGAALFSEMLDGARQPANAARFIFLEPRAQTFYREWEAQTRQIVAVLRAEAGRSPYDRQLTDLVGELSTRSDLFRKLWGAHDVREHRTGLKLVHHPVVGDLDLTFQAMDLASDRGLQMIVFSAEPGSAHPGAPPATRQRGRNSNTKGDRLGIDSKRRAPPRKTEGASPASGPA